MPLPPRTALRFQWALAVQLLLVAPIRLGNLARLELERHLLRSARQAAALPPRDPRRGGQERPPIELPLPAEATALIEPYRPRVRPVLAPPGTSLAVSGYAAPRR